MANSRTAKLATPPSGIIVSGVFAVVAAIALLSLPEEVSAGHCYSRSSESSCTAPPVGGQAACAWCNGACQMSWDDCICAGGDTLQEAQQKFSEAVNKCKRTNCAKFSFIDCKVLTALPDGIEWPVSLVVLDLRDNALTVLPNKKWPPSLAELYLYNNVLTALPDQEWPASLVNVALANNTLTVLPGKEWPASLKRFHLYNNALTVLPDQAWPASLVELDLTNNALTVLPDQEWPASLLYLYLPSNALTVLPNKEWPASLQSLGLSNNALTVLPNQEWPASLAQLGLENNALTVLPDQEWPASLGYLGLDNNALTVLPDQEWPASLVRLRLSNNALTVLPDQEWPASLGYLGLDNNALTVLPDQEWPALLAQLGLSNNALTVLPNQAWPASLQSLVLANNALTVLPGHEWPASLVDLWLYNNALTVLPEQAWPASLVTLTLENNTLTVLPGKEWPASLKRLHLYNNALTVLPDQAWPASLVILGLSNNALTVLPDQEWPASLVRLRLSNNALTVLPDQEWPASLEWLRLSNNALTVLPDQEWPASLEGIDLSNNALTVLPDQEWPASLTQLTLANNALTALPNQGWPASLGNLSLSKNALTVLPDQEWPASLEWIDLAYNVLAVLPNKEWPASLVRLQLNNNELTVLPDQEFPSSLEALSLANNALTDLPQKEWPALLKSLELNNNKLTTLPQFPLPRYITVFDPSRNLVPTNITILDLSGNNLVFDDPGAKTFNIAFSNSMVSKLDLSNNAITRLADKIAFPASLVKLDLSNNQLGALPSLKTGNFTWPPGLNQLNLNGNTWEDLDVIERAAKEQASAGFAISVAEVPCNISISANHANWDNCTVAGAEAVLDPAASRETCTLRCRLTEAGAALAAVHPAAIAAAVAEADAKYAPVWAAGIPVAAAASAGMVWAVQPSSRMEKVRIAVFFFAVVDLTTDWAFYSIDFSSSTFQKRYTCNQSAPELAPDRMCATKGDYGTSLPYSCTRNDYGVLLKSNCGKLANGGSNLDASNECECNQNQCENGVLSRGASKKCNNNFVIMEDGNFIADGALKCGDSDYNGLDAQANEICGFLSPVNGSNECECYQGTCIDIPETGGTCAQPDSADNNYNALKAACLAFNIVAVIVWVVQWASFAALARARRRHEPTADEEHCTMRKINTATMIATTLLEDVPQMYFLSTFAAYMQLFSEESKEFIPPSTAPLVILSFIMSALSMLSTVCEVIWQLFLKEPSAAATTASAVDERSGKSNTKDSLALAITGTTAAANFEAVNFSLDNAVGRFGQTTIVAESGQHAVMNPSFDATQNANTNIRTNVSNGHKAVAMDNAPITHVPPAHSYTGAHINQSTGRAATNNVRSSSSNGGGSGRSTAKNSGGNNNGGGGGGGGVARGKQASVYLGFGGEAESAAQPPATHSSSSSSNIQRSNRKPSLYLDQPGTAEDETRL